MNAIVVGTFGAIAAVRQFPGWQIDPADALQISRPLNEMLKRYPKVAEKVLEASSPVALVTAIVWLTGPRVVADRMYHAAIAQQIAAARRSAQPPPSHPAQPGPRTVPANDGTAPPGPDIVTGFPKDIAAAVNLWPEDAGLPVA